MRLAASLSIAVIAFGCTTAHRPSAAERLDGLISELHARELFDGAVVVSRDGRIVFEKGVGFADVEGRAPFTPDTAADGGSLAKTLTAELVLQLADEGRLSLDAPAQILLPELPYPDVTLRHLLTHSTGLPDYGYFDPFLPADAVRTTEDLLRVLAKEKPRLSLLPGSAFSYNSLGFDLALLAAARAAGQSYAALLEARFFAPLQMRSAFLRPGRFSEFPGIRTRGYRRKAGALVPNEVFNYEAFHGGSNIYFSARDLDRWNRSFFQRSERPERAPIGNGRSGLTFGSWYSTRDRSAYWYSGHLQGFHDEVFRDVRSRLSIVYMSNNTMEPWLQKALVRAIRTIVNGGNVRQLAAPNVSTITPDTRASMTGRWRAGEEQLHIEKSGDHLTCTLDDVAYQMFAVDDRWFYVPGLDLMIAYSSERDQLYAGSNVSETWYVRESSTPRVILSRGDGEGPGP